MESYKIFTASCDNVEDGAQVGEYNIMGVWIPALVVGELGRGCSMGGLPVEGARVGERLLFAGLVMTKSGRPKLIARTAATTDTQAIIVLRAPISSQSPNVHTGDRLESGDYAPFPGEVIAKGTIGKGRNGKMESGEQLIFIIKRGVVFRIVHSGFVRGCPREYYYMFNGERLLAATEEERKAANLF